MLYRDHRIFAGISRHRHRQDLFDFGLRNTKKNTKIYIYVQKCHIFNNKCNINIQNCVMGDIHSILNITKMFNFVSKLTQQSSTISQ